MKEGVKQTTGALTHPNDDHNFLSLSVQLETESSNELKQGHERESAKQ